MAAATALVATDDQYVLACMILRKRREIMNLSVKLFNKELVFPNGIQSAYQSTKTTTEEWTVLKSQGMPMFYNIDQYNSMSMLAQWLVKKFHEMNGTEAPENVTLWAVCYQALGVKSLKEAGLTLA